MSNTENLGLKIPTLAEKNIHTTYVNNNEIIDEAYGQYLEDKETAQENIAMIETPVAQTNHTAGSYFMLDNVLHEATENIASGEDIVSGSNATPITIEQALSALNSSVSTIQAGMEIKNLTNSFSVTNIASNFSLVNKEFLQIGHTCFFWLEFRASTGQSFSGRLTVGKIVFPSNVSIYHNIFTAALCSTSPNSFINTVTGCIIAYGTKEIYVDNGQNQSSIIGNIVIQGSFVSV